MQFKQLALAASLLATGLAAQAQTEIQWWHSMTAVNNEWVNDLAKEFNASQNDYKITPTYKGSYEQSHDRRHRRLPHRQRARHPAGVRSRHRHHDGVKSH